jgi:SPP1 gp7 family putative phage head morphogenesis protein
MKHLLAKKFWITGVLSDKLLGQSRQILLRAIETGELQGETSTKLLALFEPYVGDGKAVLPVVTEATRLETIIRTNATDAYNAGRLVQARRAGDLVNGYVYSAILDSRTTQVCSFLDGKIFRADDPAVDRLKPPRHFNCRSLLVARISTEPIQPGELMTESRIGRAIELSGNGFK